MTSGVPRWRTSISRTVVAARSALEQDGDEGDRERELAERKRRAEVRGAERSGDRGRGDERADHQRDVDQPGPRLHARDRTRRASGATPTAPLLGARRSGSARGGLPRDDALGRRYGD